MDLAEENIIEGNLFRSKGKRVTREIYVEVKPSRRQNKCFGTAAAEYKNEAPPPPPYNIITNDTWFHIAKHIEPEDIQTFALICRQTAELVNSRTFWYNLYFKYCQKSMWTLKLPEHLQVANIRHCVASTLRCRVVELLFYCYTPFVDRVKQGYCLDTLLGRTYTASWHLKCRSAWVMCYKFWNHLPSGPTKAEFPPLTVADDWEAQVNDDEVAAPPKFLNPHEGVSILIICCDRFIPLPTHILYGGSRVRLSATRQLLAKDLRSSNLELDFIDSISKAITTVRYPQILNYKVIPWWHEYFRKFVK